MKIQSLIVCVLLVSLCFNCNDESIESKSYPFVITKEAEVLNDGVIMHGEVLDMGSAPVSSYGFVISESQSPDMDNGIAIKDREFSTGAYSFTVRSGIKAKTDYYARAFAKTATYVVYGNTIKFEGRGSLPPKIQSFSPQTGAIGTPVVITGENLGFFISGTTLKFGETTATIDSISDTKIYTKVPVVTEGLTVKFSVESGGETSISENLFDIRFPWTRKADFPGTSLRLVRSFEANGKVYVLGGLKINPWEIVNEFWMYDPATNSWEEKPSFPGPVRYDAIAFSCNNKGYYGMGKTETEYLTDFWEYDPTKEQWTQKTSFPGTGRASAKSFVIQNKGYIGLGYSGMIPDGYINDLWEYNPSNDLWTKKQDLLPGKRYPGFSSASAQKGYLGMGTTGWRLDDIYEYDPLANSWELIGNYPGNGHNDIGSFYINEKIYMGMGSNNNSDSYSDFWEFDPELQTWTPMHPCPMKLSPYVSVTVGSKGYIGIGWYDLSYRDDYYGRAFYEFDPSEN